MLRADHRARRGVDHGVRAIADQSDVRLPSAASSSSPRIDFTG